MNPRLRLLSCCCAIAILSGTLLPADDQPPQADNPPAADAPAEPQAEPPGETPQPKPPAENPTPNEPSQPAVQKPAPQPTPIADPEPKPQPAAPAKKAGEGYAPGVSPKSQTPPHPQGVPGVTYFQPPMPIIAGNGWSGGYSYAYAPTRYYWYHVPGYAMSPTYVPGYTSGIGPTSWNGYWNHSTAYGVPGYTAYWHGWYAGPRYVDYAPVHVGVYALPAWGSYSTYGWGHGHWHSHRVFPPGRHWFMRHGW